MFKKSRYGATANFAPRLHEVAKPLFVSLRRKNNDEKLSENDESSSDTGISEASSTIIISNGILGGLLSRESRQRAVTSDCPFAGIIIERETAKSLSIESGFSFSKKNCYWKLI